MIFDAIMFRKYGSLNRFSLIIDRRYYLALGGIARTLMQHESRENLCNFDKSIANWTISAIKNFTFLALKMI